ncbi:hypothetical protein PanWU01x14_024530 [Parasponia andersonii]|uniref:Uncharacterized protein n=1 Tax=Parasponia andersonii TaxID=3476 RepID=A0A2P5DWM8_PARAD|nr:hypothetical protein PanWU01x14_024530 [Parasponia andersonii]
MSVLANTVTVAKRRRLVDCRAGPCTVTINGLSVADMVTSEDFNGIMNKASDPNCPGCPNSLMHRDRVPTSTVGSLFTFN